MFIKFGGMVERGPPTKPLDFTGYIPDLEKLNELKEFGLDGGLRAPSVPVVVYFSVQSICCVKELMLLCTGGLRISYYCK